YVAAATLDLRSFPTRTLFRSRLMRSPDELQRLLDNGEVDGAIVERFVASSADLSRGYSMFWLAPERFQHYQMALGLWKGDQTLRSEEHTSELQSRENLVCRLL